MNRPAGRKICSPVILGLVGNRPEIAGPVRNRSRRKSIRGRGCLHIHNKLLLNVFACSLCYNPVPVPITLCTIKRLVWAGGMICKPERLVDSDEQPGSCYDEARELPW